MMLYQLHKQSRKNPDAPTIFVAQRNINSDKEMREFVIDYDDIITLAEDEQWLLVMHDSDKFVTNRKKMKTVLIKLLILLNRILSSMNKKLKEEK